MTIEIVSYIHSRQENSETTIAVVSAGLPESKDLSVRAAHDTDGNPCLLIALNNLPAGATHLAVKLQP